YRTSVSLLPDTVVVVVGHQAQEVQKAVETAAERLESRGGRHPKLHFVLQKEQRGTGHAVMQAADVLSQLSGTVLVLYGDVPLLKPETLQALLAKHRNNNNAGTILTIMADDPTGYGRIIRNKSGNLERSVEQRDASPDERAIKEINAGIYCFEIPALLSTLDKLSNDNSQGGYYLPDVLGILVSEGRKVGLMEYDKLEEVLGINTRVELAACEKRLNRQTLERLMLAGVTVVDPDSTYISLDTEIGRDTVIHPQV